MIIIHAPLPNFKDTDFTLQASNKHGKIITPDTKSSNSFPLSLLQTHNKKKTLPYILCKPIRFNEKFMF